MGKDVDVVPNLNERIVHFQDQLGSVQIWVLLEDALASKIIDVLAHGDLSEGERGGQRNNIEGRKGEGSMAERYKGTKERKERGR